MPLYQMKIDVQPEKVEEFIRNLRTLWFDFLKEDGCLSYSVYREFEKENTFLAIGEFDSTEAIENHFRSRSYEILIGAANVLGNRFKIVISDVTEKGGYDLVKEKIEIPGNRQ